MDFSDFSIILAVTNLEVTFFLSGDSDFLNVLGKPSQGHPF